MSDWTIVLIKTSPFWLFILFTVIYLMIPVKPMCLHKKNYTIARWKLEDGTLMATKHCNDCGYTVDEYFVYGEDDDGTWNKTFEYINGKEVTHE